jgi:hypothetical protein
VEWQKEMKEKKKELGETTLKSQRWDFVPWFLLFL